jgi:hypothetical protein
MVDRIPSCPSGNLSSTRRSCPPMRLGPQGSPPARVARPTVWRSEDGGRADVGCHPCSFLGLDLRRRCVVNRRNRTRRRPRPAFMRASTAALSTARNVGGIPSGSGFRKLRTDRPPRSDGRTKIRNTETRTLRCRTASRVRNPAPWSGAEWRTRPFLRRPGKTFP